MDVDEARLRERLDTNGKFGQIDSETGRGRTVLTGSEADRQAREHLVEEMEQLGMDVRVDAVGNIAGRWTPESADPTAAPVATGSHLDSVPRGGIFDGPLGVYGGLEAVRAIRDSDREPARPIEVVSFTEEEGTRYVGLLGSSVAAGQRSVEEALALEDDDGTTLETRLERIDFQGEGRLDASRWEAWLELHPEQSTELEEAGCQAGVVSAITGLEQHSVEFVGEANHAGGTRMPDRRDALVAASTFVTDIERAAREVTASGDSFAVATVGSIDAEPNATNVVPGRVEVGLDIRDTDSETIAALRDRAKQILARIEDEHGVETAFGERHGTAPAAMSERCRRALDRAAERHGVDTLSLRSGGGHDTMNVARVTDAGLLFAPSRDGISHSPAEWTDPADCAACTRVLAEALAGLAGVVPS
ncbi:N-carbamoyl-L-amino-acid hydrolase [Halovenus aranensis]|uniref:N-carbamoyl-L-amino-acid hydrolase n=1 Tax=Halovenus aranensis TaxID=890420 RepID=A0A1G8WQQ4_9EURY|nr:M20 family metallo-hydrolase [Halovenus aranensis]SDJ80699.1 N-carbamoyl-L-amino-acid hydrolase [Halovenus aranensis]